MGYGTTASGTYATALGYSTKASGTSSTSMGDTTTASGLCSTAMGASTNASGSYSTALGSGTKANGSYATAMGLGTVASGSYATAIGRTITASGTNSLGIGLAYHNPNWMLTSNNVMSIMGGKVGIGTVSPTSTLQVVGDVNTSGKYKYSSPKTYYLQIPTAAFTSINDGWDDWINAGSFIYLTDVSQKQLVCPVNLPNGSTVTKFSIYGYNNDTINSMTTTAILIERALSDPSDWYDSPTHMAYIYFTPPYAGDTIQTASTTSISYAMINNQYNQYYIWVFLNSAVDNSLQLRFYGCSIAYTMDTVAP